MRYYLGNHAANTTAAPTAVTTGTAVKTLLQVKPLCPLFIFEWGYFLDQTPADIKIELVEVDVAATVTALADADITRLDRVSDGVASSIFMTLSTTATGFTSTNEGAVTAARNLDAPQVTSTKMFVKPFALGEEPVIQTAKFCRIRVTAAAAVNALVYIKVRTG